MSLGLQYVILVGEVAPDWRIMTVSCIVPVILGRNYYTRYRYCKDASHMSEIAEAPHPAMNLPTIMIQTADAPAITTHLRRIIKNLASTSLF